MLAFVPVTLDLYRTVRRHRTDAQNLVSYADRTGRCFPSFRTLAAATELPEHCVPPSGQLALRAHQRHRPRRRLPTRSERFRPARRRVSHGESGSHHREEKNRQIRKHLAPPDSQTKGQLREMPTSARMGASAVPWRQSRFWRHCVVESADPGCFAPLSPYQPNIKTPCRRPLQRSVGLRSLRGAEG